jgi:hypothetical protein
MAIRRIRISLLVVASLIVFGGGAVAAQSFASTGYHTAGRPGVQHGCPSDPGCLGREDDVRKAFSMAITGTSSMYKPTVGIGRASSTTTLASQSCLFPSSSCRRVDIKRTLNASDRECKYVSYHYVPNRLTNDPRMPVAAGPC